MAKKKITLKGIWEVLKKCGKGFGEDKIPKLSASLAYYTVFSLGPLLMVILFLCGIFFGREAIEGSIYSQMEGFVGEKAALQIQEIIKNASIGEGGNIAAIIGIITLLIGATTVFAEIQDSINTIWGLRRRPTAGLWITIKTRLLSFGVIISLGFLLLVSLGVSAIVEGISNRLQDRFPEMTVIVFYIINIVITLAIVSVLFAVIFRVLPDAKIQWKDIMAGAIVTAMLFMLGKFAISFYINKTDVGSTYGTAGSLVVVLVWIYYSSFILYFGAEFTKAWAMKYGDEIHPYAYTMLTQRIEVEKENKSLQQADKEKEAEELRAQENEQAAHHAT